MKKMDLKTVIKFLILILIIICIGFVAVKFTPWFEKMSKDVDTTREYIRSFGTFGAIVYVVLEVIQVIIAVIPGDIFTFSGGYIYGIPIGFLLAYLGIMIGTVIVFYIARVLGYDFIAKFIPEDKLAKMEELINSTHGFWGLLVICLIPFLPKDLMMYAAGLTPIKPSRLFLIYGISRIPGTLVWVTIGANIYEKNYLSMIIVGFIIALLFSGGFFLQQRYHIKTK